MNNSFGVIGNLALLFLVLLSTTVEAKSEKVISFQAAKNKLYSKVFNNSGKTFYCDCDWSDRKINLNSCGLQSYFPKKQRKRASRSEAEHIIPASWLLKVNKTTRQCAIDSKKTKDSARDYCRKHDLDYKQAHNDLVNLYPAVGELPVNTIGRHFLAGL